MTRIGVRTVLCAIVYAMAATAVIGLNLSGPLRAQTAAINDLSGKILNARMVQQTFAGGLQHCNEYDGTNFYFQARDRVLNLDDYHRSLKSLVLQQAFNFETKQPWDQQEADRRWAEAQQLAITDKTNCQLVTSLPDLQKQLQDLQQQAAAPPLSGAPKQ
jgi:hypothetical protein